MIFSLTLELWYFVKSDLVVQLPPFVLILCLSFQLMSATVTSVQNNPGGQRPPGGAAGLHLFQDPRWLHRDWETHGPSPLLLLSSSSRGGIVDCMFDWFLTGVFLSESSSLCFTSLLHDGVNYCNQYILLTGDTSSKTPSTSPPCPGSSVLAAVVCHVNTIFDTGTWCTAVFNV